MLSENELFSVMDELIGERSSSNSSRKNYEEPLPRVRMLPELPQYGKEERKEGGEIGSEGNIWNPNISVAVKGGTWEYIPPTNPYVEVARRRAYEKFKAKFKTAFDWITNPNKHKIHSKIEKLAIEDISCVWTLLPSHSILERAQFAIKTNETLKVLQSRQSSSNVLKCRSSETRHILDSLSKGIEHKKLIDPIMMSPFSLYEASRDMLKNEVKFQFIREWKRVTQGKGSDDAVREFCSSSKFHKKCTKLCREVEALTIEMEKEFLADLRKKANEMSLLSSNRNSKSKKNTIPKLVLESDNAKLIDNGVSESYLVKFSGLSFRISAQHLEKLQRLYDRFNTEHSSLSEHQNAFCSALFSVLARYDLLEGGGLQSSLTGHVFDVLLKRFHCNLECFASPFNCRYERYCSAFPDTDAAFGSLGSFFSYDFASLSNGGCFQANPPFASDFIAEMCKRMNMILGNESLSAPFMFIVFVPAWKDSNGWQTLEQNAHQKYHLLLDQQLNPHYYCEGTQHRKLKGRYRIASFNTSVFFLQNKAAQEKWPVTEQIVDEIRQAFAMNPENDRSVKACLDDKPSEIIDHQIYIDKPICKSSTENRKKKKKDNKSTGVSGQKKKQKVLADDHISQMLILESLGITKQSDGENPVGKTVDMMKTSKPKSRKKNSTKAK